MEIPEYNPETIPRIKDSAYWPFDKRIPVLSEPAIKKLQDHGVLETGLDNYGEDSLIIVFNSTRHFIPKYLTSKPALYFLGLNKSRVDELWGDLLKVTPPIVIPSISDGGADPFFMEIKLWLADENYERNDSVTDNVLNHIGLSEAARSQQLIIHRDGGPITTTIHEQKPKDIIPLVEKFISHKWFVLELMDEMIMSGDRHGKDWWTRLVEELTQDPIDLDEMYGVVR